MAAEPRLMTADELLRLPRGRARHAPVRGRLLTLPLNDAQHSAAAAIFGASLSTYVRAHRLGWTTLNAGYVLTVDPDTVRGADVAFVRAGRSRPADGYFHGAPDLVVDVVSIFDLYLDIQDAVADWLDYGARLLFLVNPQRRTVAAHRPNEPVRVLTVDDVLDGEDVVPGWALAVRELFEEA